MIIEPALAQASPLRKAIRDHYRSDETQAVRWLADQAQLPAEALDRIAARARALVAEVRKARVGQGGIDAFLNEFGLSTKEGVVLMCLAEALLRVPDAETVDKLERIPFASEAAAIESSDPEIRWFRNRGSTERRSGPTWLHR